MEDFLRRLSEFREPSIRNVVHVIDILLVAYLVYRLLVLVRGPRAWRILGGIIVFLVALVLSDALQLTTLHWVLDKATLLAPVALVLLLLPEVRQALEGFGSFGLWPDRMPGSERATAAGCIEEIVAAVSEMSSMRLGALIVIERGAPMDDIASSGILVNAQVSAPLLLSIFYKGNPLHDGAALIRNDRIVAACCRLPLSDSPRMDSHLHMRHRAALGISEVADCLSIVVSEERGTIAVAIDGRLERLPSPVELRETLKALIRGKPPNPRGGRRLKRGTPAETVR